MSKHTLLIYIFLKFLFSWSQAILITLQSELYIQKLFLWFELVDLFLIFKNEKFVKISKWEKNGQKMGKVGKNGKNGKKWEKNGQKMGKVGKNGQEIYSGKNHFFLPVELSSPCLISTKLFITR